AADPACDRPGRGAQRWAGPRTFHPRQGYGHSSPNAVPDGGLRRTEAAGAGANPAPGCRLRYGERSGAGDILRSMERPEPRGAYAPSVVAYAVTRTLGAQGAGSVGSDA